MTVYRVALILFLLAASFLSAQTNTAAQSGQKPTGATDSALIEKGRDLFRKDCSFCHGRDATGGESGPDLTRSKLVAADVNGDKIGDVVRNGRPDKGMPPFDRSPDQIAALAAFIHAQTASAAANGRKGAGGRRGVDPSDLQTGNVEAGQKYFNGTGGCANCHSPSGDLAGIASRLQGLHLEEQMLYPRHYKPQATVTPRSGESITGTLEYLDEFTVGLTDANGYYHSWRTRDVQYKVDGRVNAHVELFSQYTDEDIHNLMAYLQTLK